MFVAAMLPLGELRLAIPLGIVAYGMDWHQALVLAVAGNLLPVVPMLLVLGLAARILTAFPNPLGRFLLWRQERLRSAYGRRFQKYGAWALVPLVAIPLPLTGAGTGCLAAWAFDIPPRRAFPMIALGLVLAGLVVTALVLLGVNFPGLKSPS